MRSSKWFYTTTLFWGSILLITYILNHYFFRTFAFDYGAYNFAWYDFAHFHSSPNPIYQWQTDVSFIQDHFSLTLPLLSPLYWILTPLFGTYSLLIIQTTFIIWGGWGTYKLIKLKTNNELLSILGLLLYYVTYGRFASIITDCNLEIILSSLIPIFLYFFEKKSFTKATILFVFLIIGRENISLWFIFIGIFLLIEHRKEKDYKKFAFIYTLSSVLFFILLFKLIIPAIENPGRPFALFNYSALGNNPFEAFITLLTNPEKAFSLLFVNHLKDIQFNFVKIEFYFVYLFSGAIILLWRPKYLILFIPIIAQKMYNDDPIRWSIESYYSIEIVSLLPITVFLTINELKLDFKYKRLLSILLVLSASAITIYKFDIKHRTIKWYGIEKNKFYDTRMYSSPFNVNKIYNYLNDIPSNAAVSASGQIVPHLAFRKKIYFFPKVKDATYIALLQNHSPYLLTEQEFTYNINQYIFSDNWTVEIDDYPFLLLKKQLKKNQKTRKFLCNCETLNSDSSFFVQDKHHFGNAKLQTSQTSHSGHYAIRLIGKKQFGFTITIPNIQTGNHIRISTWKKGNNGVIVSSAKNNIFYKESSFVVDTDKNGWEKIQLDILIRKSIPDKKLTFYVYKTTQDNKPVFFDDFQILIK